MSLKQTRPILWTLTIPLLSMLAGCATNPYHDYYRASQVPEYDKQHLKYLSEDSTPILTASSGDTASELDEAQSHGFIIIGTSSFNAPLVETEKIAEQAKDVGATHVLYSAKPTGKVTGFAPQAMTESQGQALSEETTHTSNLAETETQPAEGENPEPVKKEEPFWGIGYLPVSYNKERYNQSATFLVKSTRIPPLGIEALSLTANQKARLGYNRGVVIKRVFYDSPAFAANLKKGDILYSVNGTVIQDARHFQTIAKSYAGSNRTMVFELLRGTEPMQLALNPAANPRKNRPILVEQGEPVKEVTDETSNNPQNADDLKTPEEKRQEAAERWAARKKAYDARIQKKQARAKDGFFMGLVHSVTDLFDDD